MTAQGVSLELPYLDGDRGNGDTHTAGANLRNWFARAAVLLWAALCKHLALLGTCVLTAVLTFLIMECNPGEKQYAYVDRRSWTPEHNLSWFQRMVESRPKTSPKPRPVPKEKDQNIPTSGKTVLTSKPKSRPLRNMSTEERERISSKANTDVSVVSGGEERISSKANTDVLAVSEGGEGISSKAQIDIPAVSERGEGISSRDATSNLPDDQEDLGKVDLNSIKGIPPSKVGFRDFDPAERSGKSQLFWDMSSKLPHGDRTIPGCRVVKTKNGVTVGLKSGYGVKVWQDKRLEISIIVWRSDPESANLDSVLKAVDRCLRDSL